LADESAVEAASEGKTEPSSPGAWLIIVAQATNVLTTIVETFGWTGAALAFFAWFIVRYATDEQKQAIIDKYVLGKDIGHVWPLILISAIFVAVAFAQHHWYKRSLGRLRAEVDREGSEKSKLQEKLLGRKLQHAQAKPRKKK
jgi:hypothetical protein